MGFKIDHLQSSGTCLFFVLDVSCQGMAISKLRVSVAEELSSSAEQLLRQKLAQSSISPCTLLGGDPKHMHSSQDAGEP